jgi:iron complex outermembrane receptor protein
MCVRAGIILPAICAAVLLLTASSVYAESAAGSTAAPDSTRAAGAVSALGSDIKLHFDLAAGPLDKALRDFAVQASRNISYEPSIVAGFQGRAIKGEFTVRDALSLLLKGTKLHAVDVDNKTIRILDKADSAAHSAVGDHDNDHVRSTGFDTAFQMGYNPPLSSGSSPGNGSEDSSSNDTKMHNKNDLDEITVTGTHIRGTTDSPSPVLVFTRADIDAAGTNTIQQFLQSLPQNFGGASENTIGAIASNGQTNNTVNGAAPNLRGLGASATLVLINGHRVAPGNSDASFVDISMIPLTAVERIEIVTDGASAIYGADAVGGVVNIILRTKFDGAETRVQYGTVSDGSMHNVQIGQTVGTDWTGGSGALSYQYFDQTPLSAASRDYLNSVPLPFDLLPEQVQQSVFANADQEVASGFNIHGDVIYSHRGTNTAFSQEDAPIYYTSASPTKVDFYGASLGSTLKLRRQSELTLEATYSESDTAQQLFQTYQIGEPSSVFQATKTKSAVISVDANLDGILASIPTGSIRYAVGAQYRKESFGNTFTLPVTNNTFHPSRDVDAGYVELHVPVIGQTSGSHGDPALELTLADRAEHYSDFGSTNNPQFGLIGRVSPSVTIRGTYGTSFVAPLLSQLNPVPSVVLPVPGALFSPVPGQTIPNTLIVDGGNPDLEPEKARVWTVGLDFKPPEVEGLATRLTYYNIVFTNKITSADASINIEDAFADEAVLGPSIVQRNPPSSLVQRLISQPTYENPFNVNPATIGALINSESMNLSSVKTRGLDFGLGYKRTIFGTGIDTGVDGTYIFTFDNQFSSSAPVESLLNTTYNPINLKLRARALATRGPLSYGIYVNFTNDYSNNNVAPYAHVSSWTTADAAVSYEFGSSGTPFNGVTIALSVINLTNREPPYVAVPGTYSAIAYDGNNANVLGRYISLRLQKRW